MLSEAPERTRRMSWLAQQTNATLPRLSKVVRRLEDKGLVGQGRDHGPGPGHAGPRRSERVINDPGGAGAVRLTVHGPCSGCSLASTGPTAAPLSHAHSVLGRTHFGRLLAPARLSSTAPSTTGAAAEEALTDTITLGTSAIPSCTPWWSRLGESNPGPTHYECVALPSELRRQGTPSGVHGRPS